MNDAEDLAAAAAVVARSAVLVLLLLGFVDVQPVVALRTLEFV